MNLMRTVLLAVLALVLSQATGAQNAAPRELAAQRLQHRGEWLLEYGDPDTRATAAMAIFEQVVSEYPDTELRKWARLKQVQCLQWMRRYDDAIALSEEILKEHPGELVAAWAQLFKGISDLRDWEQGAAPNYLNAFLAFQKVRTDYQHLDDQGPVQAAEARMGDIIRRIDLCPAGTTPDSVLALAANQDELVLILGQHISSTPTDEFNFDLNVAIKQFALLRDSYPESSYPLARTALSIGEAFLDSYLRGNTVVTVGDLLGMEYILGKVSELAPDDHYLVSRAALALAKYYSYSPIADRWRAAQILQGVLSLRLTADVGPELMYTLGHRLAESQQHAEAEGAWAEILDKWPTSGFAWTARRDMAALKLLVGDYEGAEKSVLAILEKDTQVYARFRARQMLCSIYQQAAWPEKEKAALESLLELANGWLSDGTSCSPRWQMVAEDAVLRCELRLAELREEARPGVARWCSDRSPV